MSEVLGTARPPQLLELDRGTSLALLGSVPLGRLVLQGDELALVVPVNFVLCGEAVYVRTTPTSQLARAVERGDRVTFEADQYDALGRHGWSVVVRGRATRATAADVAALHGHEPDPWPAGDRPVLVRITAELVEGRRAGGPQR